ncbi:polyamine aminopropyltransferase [candidate division FCPU426 bacterium]|nr:polyamine aminopropyltransferase [candidate division FCPU426 bacterium]
MDVIKAHLFVEMYSPNEGHLHGFKKVLVEGKTDFQTVEIVDTHEYGRCLLLDGKMQSSQMDEYIYHEFLVHPACTTHPHPRRVMIIGGGEGATLREVLRHADIERVDMIEIDAKVVDFAKRHLAEWHQGAFADKRCRLIVEDGRRYAETTGEQYDLIIIDVSDPGFEGPAYLLYTVQFYQAIARCLAPGGLIALQAGSSSVIHGEIMASVYRTLKKVFFVVRGYEASIPSFNLPWGFFIASRTADPKSLAAQTIDRRLAEREVVKLRAYDGETHEGLFKITKALRQMLETQGRVIEDKSPMYTPL